VACPLPLAYVRIAERFGGWPWDIETAPLDRVQFYLGIMGVEAEGQALVDGLADDEDLILEGDY
jgi:hypothetical protein